MPRLGLVAYVTKCFTLLSQLCLGFTLLSRQRSKAKPLPICQALA